MYLIIGYGQAVSSGEGGIRTHAPLRTNGFQDRLVMTTSIPLQVFLQKKNSGSFIRRNHSSICFPTGWIPVPGTAAPLLLNHFPLYQNFVFLSSAEVIIAKKECCVNTFFHFFKKTCRSSDFPLKYSRGGRRPFTIFPETDRFFSETPAL